MSQPIIPREEVAEQFSVAVTVLSRYESRGLIHTDREGPVEGYRPEDIRRLWTILSLQRDLGVNLAGVEAILALRSRMDDLQRRLHALAAEVRATLDEPTGSDADA